MQKKKLCFTICFTLILFSVTTAQSDWQGTWSNYDTHNHSWIMQVKIKDDLFTGIKYINEDWKLYKVEFKGELSKKGKKVSGTYRYTDNSESGKFELKIDQFNKTAPQFAEGVELFFEGELGINKYNMRNWNGTRRSIDTSLQPLRDFVETFKKERPKKYTAEEMITLVHDADFLHEYRLLTVDAAAPAIATCEMQSYCKEGVFTVHGLNPYIIADYCFFKEGNLSRCAIYLNISGKIIQGDLVNVSKDAKGNDVNEYKLYGTIDDAVITKMIVKGKKAEIYFSNYTDKGKLVCQLEN